MFLECGRKPEDPEKTHAGPRRTCKLYAGRPELELNLVPLHCEIDALTTGPSGRPREREREELVGSEMNNMPAKKKSSFKVGLRFFAFLKETGRSAIRARSELKEIYNTEFKARNQGITLPNFSSVLYALKVSNKINVGKDKIRVKFAVTELSVDQWHISRRAKAEMVISDVEAKPSPSQPLLSAVEEMKNDARHFTEMLKRDRPYLISDKNGIVIGSDHEFTDGSICLEPETDQFVVNLNVENTGTQIVHFTYYTALGKLSCFTLKDEHKVTRKNPLLLKPGESYAVQVQYHFEYAGNCQVALVFEFQHKLHTAFFYIMRDIHVYFLNALAKELKPTAPYKRFCRVTPRGEQNCKVVDGVPPDGLSRLELKSKTPLLLYQLPKYLPKHIRSLNMNPPIDKSAVLGSCLSFRNYSRKLHELLYLEEFQMQLDITRYFIPNSDTQFVRMKRDPSNKKLLILQVPGLSENRPSVLRGDRLLVYLQGEPDRPKYCGYVHKVERDSVKLGFSAKLLDLFLDGMKFSVEFTFNRLILRLQHRAVDFATKFQLEKLLFPPASLSSKQVAQVPKLSFYDRQLEKNPEQSKAVRHIVAGTSKPAPYLVFGPPGTGKTVTLVEAIKQVDKLQKECHILACGPSNSAADILCRRILQGHGNKSTVYRMYASSRDPQCVPGDLKACSNLVGDDYVFPSREKLMEYRIIVTTLFTAGRLVTGNLPLGHFTHIFVDEAGHATESECLIPIAGLLDPESGQLVLAGDHKQLGPIVASSHALKYGMGISLLERMMNVLSANQKGDDFNDLFVTKLLRNYRSHPSILKVPNELFYGGELQACAELMKRNYFCTWEHLEKPDFPLIFHGVAGIDEREATSPSFFNRAEVQVLMDYVKKLLETAGKKGLATILPKDIGIITPYRKQVQKIRQALLKVAKEFKFKDMSGLKVGSVEEFQGQESKVILVSTVRSSSNYIDFDKRFNLGFVANKKRFNVAMTRAQALLIVVGNPVVLSTDDTWKYFIKYCQDSKAYRGFKPVEEEEAVAERYSHLFRKMHSQVEDDADEAHSRQPEE